MSGPLARPVLRLREVRDRDLRAFYEQQADPEAIRLAGLEPRLGAVFDEHYARVLADPANFIRTIEVDGEPAGHIAAFPRDGRHELGYWLAREHWGRGIVSWAIAQFLPLVPVRPLHAVTAVHNTASVRALERAGFVREGELDDFGGERGSGARGLVMRLD